MTLADLKLVHFVVVFTLKGVDSLSVVSFTHGFLQKKGENDDIGSLFSHTKKKSSLTTSRFLKENHFAKQWTIKQQ